MGIHDDKRDDPRMCTRQELLLRTAIDRSGWTVIGYEYKYGAHYYDVAIMYKGRRMLIDLDPGRSTGGRKATVKKVAYCKQEDQPLCIVDRASTHHMQGQITAWLAMQGG